MLKMFKNLNFEKHFAEHTCDFIEYNTVPLVERFDFGLCVLRRWDQTFKKKGRPDKAPGKLRAKVRPKGPSYTKRFTVPCSFKVFGRNFNISSNYENYKKCVFANKRYFLYFG